MVSFETHKKQPKRAGQQETESWTHCSLELWSQTQSPRVEVDVVPHEGGDEVVGVVVERLHPQLHVVVVLRRRHKEVLRLQLVVKEPVGCALVDEERYLRSIIVGNKLSGVISFPSLNRSQGPGEGLLSPRHHGGVADWRERGDRGEHAGVLEMADQGAVASHAVTCDTPSLSVHWEEAGYQFRQFLGNVCVHVVVFLPLFCCCINIEACTRTKVVRVILALNRNLWSCRCVREDNSQPVLGRLTCKVRFRSRVLVCARQPGKVVEDRWGRCCARLGCGQEDGEGHLALVRLTPVRQLLHEPALHLHVALQLWQLGLGNITLSDVDDGSQTLSAVESIDGSIHLVQALECVGDEGFQGHLSPHHSLHQLRHLRPRLPASKGSALPVPSSDKLERPC